MNPEDVLRRVRALLALADDRAAYPAEAESARATAQRLMATHGLTQADVALEPEPELFVRCPAGHRHRVTRDVWEQVRATEAAEAARATCARQVATLFAQGFFIPGASTNATTTASGVPFVTFTWTT